MIALLGLMIAAMAPTPRTVATTAPALAGNWAGDGFALRATTTGYVVQGKCASGKITSRIVPDANGHFSAGGYYNAHGSGYRLADVGRRDVAAQFNGIVTGDTLKLTMAVAGRDPAAYVLQRGARISFPKCP